MKAKSLSQPPSSPQDGRREDGCHPLLWPRILLNSRSRPMATADGKQNTTVPGWLQFPDCCCLWMFHCLLPPGRVIISNWVHKVGLGLSICGDQGLCCTVTTLSQAASPQQCLGLFLILTRSVAELRCLCSTNSAAMIQEPGSVLLGAQKAITKS